MSGARRQTMDRPGTEYPGGVAVRYVNRYLLVIRPKEPYVHWANSVGDGEDPLGPQDFQHECTTYLIDESVDRGELEGFLKRNYRLMFETELESWYRDETSWPLKLGYEMFREWFDVEFHSIVIDLFDHEPLFHEFEP